MQTGVILMVENDSEIVEQLAEVAHLLVIGGVFVTVSIFERSKASREKLAPAPYLSRGANTVWQMDREA